MNLIRRWFGPREDPLVALYMDRLMGDEKWQGYFTHTQADAILDFAEVWLKDADKHGKDFEVAWKQISDMLVALESTDRDGDS